MTLINVFTVDPEKQDRLVKLLDTATEETIRHLPGFISANIHRSRRRSSVDAEESGSGGAYAGSTLLRQQ
ncbi:MAG: antibiotic biosynthesis monooxygenase [Candidatus Dormibacteraceae bacterium]